MRLTGIAIRDGRHEDVANVLELWERAGSVLTPTDDARSLAALVAHDAGALLVAETDETMVGTVIAGWDGWRASFYRLAVAPSHRRRGLATELVRIAEDRLRERGAIRLTAIVAEGEAPAYAFWQALGYEWRSDHLRVVKDIEPGDRRGVRDAAARGGVP